MVGVEGFEPPTLWSQTRCATKLRYTPNYLGLTDYSSVSAVVVVRIIQPSRKCVNQNF